MMNARHVVPKTYECYNFGVLLFRLRLVECYLMLEMKLDSLIP